MGKLKFVTAAILLSIFLFSLSGTASVNSDSQSGSFTLAVQGYTVTGYLSNAAIAHGGGVQMLMSIDQSITTSYGVVHITGSGVWSGQTDFQTFSGAIGNVAGTLQTCQIFYCQNTDFTGSGTWSGVVGSSSNEGSQGSGAFQGTLTFNGQQGGPTGSFPISGNWTATFQT